MITQAMLDMMTNGFSYVEETPQEYGITAVNVNEFYQAGDLVVVAIRNQDTPGSIMDFKAGRVIFSNRFYCTVEVECISNRRNGKVTAYRDNGTQEPYKVRYTFDRADIARGLIKQATYDENQQVVTKGYNPLWLTHLSDDEFEQIKVTNLNVVLAEHGKELSALFG